MFRLNVPASFKDCMSVKEQIMWLFFHKEFTLKAGANVTITREGDETVISAKGDGFAPIVRITTIPGGHRVTVIDAEHPQGQSFDVMDGVDGQDGADGQDGQDGQDGADGEDGTSIIVKAVNTVPGGVNLVLEDRNGDHTIFLTNGPEGPQGAQGPQGPQGETGATGAQGPAGFSPTISSEPITGGHRLTITDITGTSSVDVLDGENAAAATIMVGTTTTSAPGGNASVVNSGSSSAAVLDFTIPRGAQGPQGVQGPQGIQGIQGEQGEEGEQGPAGPGVAAGGTAGQILAKVSATDYDTEWCDGVYPLATKLPAGSIKYMIGTSSGSVSEETEYTIADESNLNVMAIPLPGGKTAIKIYGYFDITPSANISNIVSFGLHLASNLSYVDYAGVTHSLAENDVILNTSVCIRTSVSAMGVPNEVFLGSKVTAMYSNRRFSNRIEGKLDYDSDTLTSMTTTNTYKVYVG